MDKSVDSDNPVNTSHLGKFVSPSILLFIDQLLVAAGNWIFWLVISKFTTTSEIGIATSTYSLILLASTSIQLGLEYPLLKKAMQKQDVFGTALILEMAITIAAIPVVIYFASTIYQEPELVYIALGILVLSSASFVARFGLLAASNAKAVLLFDLIGTVFKFGTGIILVGPSLGLGALGILLSILFQTIAAMMGTLVIGVKTFRLRLPQISLIKEVAKDGLANAPSKLSNLLVVSLSVVLLSSFGTDSSEVGIFYIAIMISIVAGTFASSLAFMSIPASSSANSDLSTGSLRLGLVFTAPIIVALIVGPSSILSIIGTDYTEASDLLLILAIGILPTVIVANAMSRFNNLNKMNELLAIGMIRIVVFIVLFLLFVPMYGAQGAAYAILLSATSSATLAILLSDRILIRHVAISILAIIAGITLGVATKIYISNEPFAITLSVIASLFSIISFKGTSIREISILIRTSVRRQRIDENKI